MKSNLYSTFLKLNFDLGGALMKSGGLSRVGLKLATPIFRGE